MSRNYGESFNVAHLEPLSHIYGPGKRYVVWFQGCSLACEGCWNQEMWSFSPRDVIHRQTLLEMILSENFLDGVTFLGGEPLHQVKNLIWLIRQIRSQSKLTVFLYTGYEIDELRDMDLWDELNELCDMVAVGRYQAELRNITRQWLGSDNQQIIYTANTMETERPQLKNEAEIIITESGSVRIIGYPDKGLISE